MTPGTILDTLLSYILLLTQQYPLLVVGLAIVSLCLAIIRALVNHYNFTRAQMNAAIAFTFLAVWSTGVIFMELPDPSNEVAWRMIAFTTLLIGFLMIAYYLAAMVGRYFGDPLTTLKKDFRDLLAKLRNSVDSTIEEQPKVEKIEEKAVATIAEALTENATDKDLAKLRNMIGLL